ncbi:MAG: ATP-binding protein [Lachnospiraceae bacterium]
MRQLDTISQNKTNFLSNVSHEVRTPINSILAINEMILRECQDNTIREYASNIESAGNMLLQIINDILDFSKIEAGKFEILPVEYQLADVITDLKNMIRPLIQKKEISFHVKLSDNLPQTLRGDVTRIRQMVTNLLTNAVKYTEKGSITMEVDGEIQEGQFLFSYRITDTGKGIKEKDIDSLFTAFNRFDKLENNGIEGTGLGLAITKKFAEMMDGSISVESTYKKGSTFTITIPQDIVDATPMKTEQKKHVSKAAYKETFHAPNAKILAVDDTPMNLSVLKALLKQTQIQITTCTSGKECLDISKNESFDIILLDHMMPDFDGIDTFHVIRREHYCDNTPIIVLTANAQTNAKEYYQNLGFNDYLSKPLVPQVLEQLIMEYIPEEKLSAI